jgi:uncharacterized protein
MNTSLTNELSSRKASEQLLIQQADSYLNQLRECEHKTQLLQQDYNDQVAESKEAMEFISKQKNEIEIFKKEQKESNKSQQLLQKELKLLSLQYEKLEKAFVDSIEKIMNHRILILDERDEDEEDDEETETEGEMTSR